MESLNASLASGAFSVSTSLVPNLAETCSTSTWSMLKSGTSRLALPVSAAICSCRSMIGWMAWWPKARAATMSSSLTSFAPHSTIRMASRVPAMRRSRSDSASWVKVGLMMNSPLIRPTRTAPTGPPQGMSEIMTAAEAALIANTSSGFSPSADSENMMT